jgi:predicted metalloprotease with PDZ domain
MRRRADRALKFPRPKPAVPLARGPALWRDFDMTQTRFAPLLLAALVAAAPLRAQDAPPAPQSAQAVLYDVSFPNLVHREAEITVRFRAVPAGPLEVRMARSSPGRYALHEFAKNAYNVRATDAAGRALAVERVSPHAWRVSGHRGEVRFSYTLYADRADGTYAGIDPTRAHLNAPATFAYAASLANRPIQVTFQLPDRTPAWRIATQLEPTGHATTFRAPNLQYLFDSPTHLGALDIREWQVTRDGRTQTIRLAVNHTGSADEVTRLEELTKKVINEMAMVFGEMPQFDYGTYTFIACYRSNCAGDGMEHRNSTSLTSGASLGPATLGLLGTVSHEFVHAWNVERIRPQSLEPFDFTEANMSGELWIAEGFTNYYGPLVIARAGIITPSAYAGRLSGAVNALTNTTARRFGGAAEMSRQAPFVDAAVSIDPNNRTNTFLSYYTYGEALGIALDLMLRARTPAVTLDDYMRAMWVQFGRAQTAALAPARAYTLADAERVLGEVAGDAAFARDFFARYVFGSEAPDYPTLLARAGFLVRQSNTTSAWMGDTRLSAQDGEVIVAGPTTIGTPMYEAGLAAGDRILTLGDSAMATNAQVAAALAAKRPGDSIRITWRARDGERSALMTLRASPRVEVVAFEDAGRTPTAEQLAFRERWLSARFSAATP